MTKYDFATVLARNGQDDEAFSLLRQAVDHGLLPRLAMDMVKDPWLDPRHGGLCFPVLNEHVNERLGSQRAVRQV